MHRAISRIVGTSTDTSPVTCRKFRFANRVLFFNEIIVHCNVLVDLHTALFYRTNLPQVRGDLRRPEVARVAEAFTSTAIIHSPGASGTLRRAAVEHGVPTITLEAVSRCRPQEQEVEHGVQGIFALIDQLGMYRKLRVWGTRSRCTTGRAGCGPTQVVSCSRV